MFGNNTFHKITAARAITSVLAIVLLVSVFGCSQESADAKTETSAAALDSETKTEETQYPAPEIVDYGGYNFRIYAYEDGFGYLGNYVVDEDNGDPVDSAIYNRNVKIEDEYKIKISATVKTDVKDQMRKCTLRVMILQISQVIVFGGIYPKI